MPEVKKGRMGGKWKGSGCGFKREMLGILWFWKGAEKVFQWGIGFSINGARKLDIHIQK